ncbi:MAG: hypothetical protein CMH53_00135, partial [Myxococcales bacterium]|nr:hypothetical protein [Myxococcales bacterium]
NKEYFSPTFFILTKLNGLKAKWSVAQGEEKDRLTKQMKDELEIIDYMRLLYKTFGAIGL